jgi:hypothetical protein
MKTVDLEDETAAKLELAARDRGLSPSQMVENLLRQEVDRFGTDIAPKTFVSESHDFGNPPDFDYRKAMDRLDQEETVEYRRKAYGE